MSKLQSNLKAAAFAILLVASLLIQIVAWTTWFPAAAKGKRSDFGEFYTAGYCVRTGQASLMYDDATQEAIQKKFIPEQKPEFIPYLHLPYEALLFVPLAGVTFKTAFLLFVAFDLLAIAFCLYWLAEGRRSRMATAGLVFIPLSVSAICGQDSLLLLLVLTMSWLLLDGKNEDRRNEERGNEGRGNEFWAGIIAGLGLFRFQIVIPVAVLFLLWRRWRFVTGVATSGVALVLVSVLLVGPHELAHYFRDVSGLAASTGYPEDNHFNISINGLAMVLAGESHLTLVRAFVAGLTLLVMARIFFSKAATTREALGLALPAALLAGIHVHFYDAAILAIPIVPALSQSRMSWPAFLLVAAGLIPVLNPGLTFLFTIPLIAYALLQAKSIAAGSALRVSVGSGAV